MREVQRAEMRVEEDTRHRHDGSRGKQAGGQPGASRRCRGQHADSERSEQHAPDAMHGRRREEAARQRPPEAVQHPHQGRMLIHQPPATSESDLRESRRGATVH